MRWPKAPSDASIEKAQAREAHKTQVMLYSVLSAIPLVRWEYETDRRRAVIRTTHQRAGATTDMVNRVKIVREVAETTAQTNAPRPTGLRQYKVYFDRILMTSEQYTDETPSEKSLGGLFERVSAHLSTAMPRSEKS